MRRLLIIILPLLAMAGCSSPDLPAPSPESANVAAVSTSATAQAQGGASSASAQSVSGGAQAVARSDDLAEFKFSYPAAVGRIPALAQLIEGRAAEAEAEMRLAAQRDSVAAREGGYDFRPHSLSFEWEVIADLPRFLSLSNSLVTYTGGAHGMYGVSSLVWDRQAGRALDAAEMFTSPAALQQALGTRFCRALDQERRDRRGDDGKLGGTFDGCPSVDELTVLVGSGKGRTFDRLTLYAGPYVAGPYAEGAYEIDLPVDSAVLAAVKPEYRDAFSTR